MMSSIAIMTGRAPGSPSFTPAPTSVMVSSSSWSTPSTPFTTVAVLLVVTLPSSSLVLHWSQTIDFFIQVNRFAKSGSVLLLSWDLELDTAENWKGKGILKCAKTYVHFNYTFNWHFRFHSRLLISLLKHNFDIGLFLQTWWNLIFPTFWKDKD